jgi:hypothetical protein
MVVQEMENLIEMSVSHLLHEAFLGMRAVVFLAKR